LVGVNIGDLVARADQSAKSAPKVGTTARSTPRPAAQDVDAMLKEFEIAAARAGKSRPLPSYEPRSARSTPAAPTAVTPPSQHPQEPVTIEVYRAPRVEVYRRRPQGGFDRD
jgi:branched-chain amino acid transport system ATP-binding protein